MLSYGFTALFHTDSQSLPLYSSISMLLNDDIVGIAKPDGRRSLTCVVDEF